MQFVESLLNQLVAVRQDQGATAPALHEQGEDDRFARAGGQDEQRALHPACGSGQQGGDGFVLVGTRGQAQQRGSSDSRHRWGPQKPWRVGSRHTVSCDPRILPEKYVLIPREPAICSSGVEVRRSDVVTSS